MQSLPTSSPFSAFSSSDGGATQWWLFHRLHPQTNILDHTWLDGDARRVGRGVRRLMFESQLGYSLNVQMGLQFLISEMEKPICPPHRPLRDQRIMLVLLCLNNTKAGSCCFSRDCLNIGKKPVIMDIICQFIKTLPLVPLYFWPAKSFWTMVCKIKESLFIHWARQISIDLHIGIQAWILSLLKIYFCFNPLNSSKDVNGSFSSSSNQSAHQPCRGLSLLLTVKGTEISSCPLEQQLNGKTVTIGSHLQVSIVHVLK